MPEAIAKRWVPGAGPVEIEPLTSGLVNRSYRVTRAGRQYSLRIAAADAHDLGLERRWECRIRTLAGAAELAAALHHCDPVLGIVVADWVPGRCWTAEEIRLPENIEAMAELLRRVHALTIPEPARRLSPADWIALYTPTTPATLDRTALRAAAATRLAALGAVVGGVLCHSDVHRLNVVSGERLVLLDWEYAHVSEPLWDLAGWIANNDWSAATGERLLASYHCRPVNAEDTSRLALLVWLYDYVCLLWSERYAVQRPGAPSEGVRARAAELKVRLGA